MKGSSTTVLESSRRGASEVTMTASPVSERRRTHEVRSLGVTLARLLVTQPSLDEVSRLIVSLLAGPVSAQGAGVVAPSPGSIEWLGSYLPDAPAWDPGAPIGGSFPAVIHQALSGTPGVEPRALQGERLALAAWPLGSPVDPVGAVIVLLRTPVDEARVRSCLEDVVDVLALYVAGMRRGHSEPDPPPGLDGAGPGNSAADLTPRQREILQWMAAGLTIRQIANRIGFSDSTVRSESLAIYRALGVHDRHNAVAAARALDLLSSP